MTMRIILKSYLHDLKSKEGGEKVPTIRDLAKSIGMEENTLFNISNNRIKQLSLETSEKIISEMRRRGFNMQVSDLLMYQDDSISQSVQN